MVHVAGGDEGADVRIELADVVQVLQGRGRSAHAVTVSTPIHSLAQLSLVLTVQQCGSFMLHRCTAVRTNGREGCAACYAVNAPDGWFGYLPTYTTLLVST